MRPLIAVVQKELLLLMRNRAGLLVLFVMPAVLVVVITLVQENVLKSMGQHDTSILVIDGDRQALGRHIVAALEAAPGVHVIRTVNGKTPDRRQALDLVSRGTYQLCLIIPPGMTLRVKALARRSALDSLSGKTADTAAAPPPALEVYFDPTVMGSFRSAVRNQLELMVLRLEVGEKAAALARMLPARINQSLTEALKPVAGLLSHRPKLALKLNWPKAPLLRITNRQAGKPLRIPTSVQQNVPAWTLFGIFFIVLPMAGTFIQERINGTHQRMLAMPVNDLTLMIGRILAYTGVCLVQCVLIGCIGKWILPLWGSPPLEMGGTVPALVIMTAGIILAATGYGIFLGTVVVTYEQVSMIGPISIVIAAALGGIMVPVYAMPAFMQKISLFSPLAWGLNGVLDVFVRGGGAMDVLPQAGKLTAFFGGSILLAWLYRRRQRLNGEIV
jgi:ABC-2 type transport system permease protein